MTWKFDQARTVVCIACRSVFEGHPILVVTHYEDDHSWAFMGIHGHSWAFMDGEPFESATALVVAMSEVVDRHPDLDEIAELPPGWSASRTAVGQPWSKQKDDWVPE
ncbi:MAG: hypothetical protein ABI471_08435 [Sphingomonas bacterium]